MPFCVFMPVFNEDTGERTHRTESLICGLFWAFKVEYKKEGKK